MSPSTRAPAAPAAATPPRRRGRPRGAQTRLLSSQVLGRHHFAFLRAVLDGIAPADAWARYLAFTGDAEAGRRAGSQLRAIADTLHRLAATPGQAGLAGRLLPVLQALASKGARRLQPTEPGADACTDPAGATGPGDAPDRPGARETPGAAGAPGTSSAPDTAGAPAPAPAQPPPPLDTWIAQQAAGQGIDPDFHSHAEWLALYQEALGAEGEPPPADTRPAAPAAWPAIHHARAADASEAQADGAPATRGGRVGLLSSAARRAALADLAALEPALVRAATLDDPATQWLAARLCQALQAAGALSLRDVVQLANLHGFHWHQRVPGLGAVRARRLLQWLGPLAEAQGLPLRESCLRRASDRLALQRLGRPDTTAGAVPQAGPEPLLEPPAEAALEPTPGAAPTPRPRTTPGRTPGPTPAADHMSAHPGVRPAHNDQAAIAAWAQRFQGRTRLDHQRIAERFLRWCLQVRRLPGLAAVADEDLQAYRAFIAAPPPDWVQPGRVARDDAAWRPFRGPLSAGSQRRECAVLASLFATLHGAGQLPAPALQAMRAAGLPAPVVKVQRALDAAQWAFALQVLHGRPDGPQRRRLQLLLQLLGGCGLRLGELATARWQDLQPYTGPDGRPACLLRVVGPGGHARSVPLPDGLPALIDAHQRDMQSAGLGLHPAVQRVRRPPQPRGGRLPGPAPAQAARPAPAPPAPAAAHAAGDGESDADALRWRPLVGILRPPPPRRRLDSRGLPGTDPTPSQADRYGALEPGAIQKLLRRFFRDVAAQAAATPGAPDPAGLARASAHWLRHSFARQVVQQLPPQSLQGLLGLQDPRSAAAYLLAGPADAPPTLRALQARWLQLPVE